MKNKKRVKLAKWKQPTAPPPHAEIVAGKKINEVVSVLNFNTILCKYEKIIKIMIFKVFLTFLPADVGPLSRHGSQIRFSAPLGAPHLTRFEQNHRTCAQDWGYIASNLPFKIKYNIF